MNFSERFLKVANALISFLVALVFLIAGAYAAYALWDNNTVYAAAENVQADMLRLKPVVDLKNGNEASFKDLLAINQDVRAWITLDHTNIDYPVLQGATNLTYINTNVYGEFALAGSIFLDTRSAGSLKDRYSLIYGHDMIEGRMFGDLSLYKDETFFQENSTGKLILPDRTYDLTVYAVLVLQSSDEAIFNPETHKSGLSGLLKYVDKNALHQRSDLTESIKKIADSKLQILSLTTCSAEFTDARTIVLAVMEPSDLKGADE